MAEAHYRIGTVARLSGLSTHVIRVWERRYAVLAPDRTPGGARLYDDDDVARLRVLKRAVDAGHPIGTLADLPNEEIERLSASASASAALSYAEEAEGFVADVVQALGEFDETRAEQVLASAGRELSPRSLVIDVLGPLLARIGHEWASGTLCTASEHLGSVLIRNRLGALIREHQPVSSAEPVVAATPAGELHELGALLAVAVATLRGHRVLYLGPDLPASEIAKAVRGTHARLLLLSIVALPKQSALREVEALQRELPTGVDILLGGASSADVASSFTPPLQALQSLLELDEWLDQKGPPS
jgi:DNA-binding transcriptional MerR regulator